MQPIDQLWILSLFCIPCSFTYVVTSCMHYQQVLNLTYELLENGKNVPKPVVVLNDHNYKCVCIFYLKLILQVNIKQNA